MQLTKGQKIPLSENFLTFKFERPISALEIDFAAFLSQSNGKVAGDDDFVFYGNKIHLSNAVILNDDASIQIFLDKVPRHVEKISLTATIYDADKRNQNFSMIRGATLMIFSLYDEIATFPLENFTVETAIVLGEVYRYKGNWKFNAIGAGFSGGLAALCNNFGIEVKDSPPPQPKKINTRREKSSRPEKIEFRKGQKLKLIKKGYSLGEIVVNLNWNQPNSIDLNLACLYELKDGTIGAVQALGNNFGSLNSPPYIDFDRENLCINGNFADKIRRILIFTFIYSGAANWQEANAFITLNCPRNPEFILKIDEYGSKNPTCAIALLENAGGTFSVEKIVEFFNDSEQMDRAFDWGIRWKVGRKN